jgi:hypothetical protein
LPETNVSSLVLPTRTRKRTFLPLGYGFYPLKGKQNRRRGRRKKKRQEIDDDDDDDDVDDVPNRTANSFSLIILRVRFFSSSSLLWNRFPFLSLFIFFFSFTFFYFFIESISRLLTG